MTSVAEARPARPARTAIRRPASGIVIDPARLTWWRDRRAMSRQDLSDAITRLALAGHPDALPFGHRKAVTKHEDPFWYVRYWDPDTGEDNTRAFGGKHAARDFKAEADAALPVHPVSVSAGGNTCTACGAPAAGGLTRDALAKIENGERRPKARTLRAVCAALSTGPETVLPGHLQPGGPPLALSPAARDRQARHDYNEGMRQFADALGREDLYRNASNRVYYSKELREMYERYLAETGIASAVA